MPHPIDVHVGSRVREARNTKGLSQNELGVVLGVSFQQLQKYEKGTNRIGSSRLWDIALALDTPVTYFFEGIDDSEPATPLNLPRRTIALAAMIDEIPNDAIRTQILRLIKSCVDHSPEEA